MSEKKNSDIIKQEAQAEKNSTFEEFNENTLRVRRNLLIFSVIALFYKLSGATLTGKSSFLGLEFEHTDPEMIDLFLLWIVIYHYIHFFWLAYEHLYHHITSYLDEEFEKLGLRLEELENGTKENPNKYKSEVMDSEIKKLVSLRRNWRMRFIKINKWRYRLIETSLPLLIGFFAVIVFFL